MDDQQSAEFLANMAKLGDLRKLAPEDQGGVYSAANQRRRHFNLFDDFPTISKETIISARRLLMADPEFGGGAMSEKALNAEINRRYVNLSEADNTLIDSALGTVNIRGEGLSVPFVALGVAAGAVPAEDVAKTPMPRARHETAYRAKHARVRTASEGLKEEPGPIAVGNPGVVKELVRLRRDGVITRLTSSARITEITEVAARFYGDPSMRMTVTQADLASADTQVRQQTRQEIRAKRRSMSPVDLRTSRIMAEKFLEGDINELEDRAVWPALKDERKGGPSSVSIPDRKHQDMAAGIIVGRTSLLKDFSGLAPDLQVAVVNRHGDMRNRSDLERAAAGVRSLFTSEGAKALEDVISNPPEMFGGKESQIKAAFAKTFRDIEMLQPDDPARRKAADLAAKRGLAFVEETPSIAFKRVALYSHNVTSALVARVHALDAIDRMAQDPAHKDMHSLPNALDALAGQSSGEGAYASERIMRQSTRSALRNAGSSVDPKALVVAAVALRHSELQELRTRETAGATIQGE